MKNKFSLYTDIELSRKIIKDIDRGVRITLGPTGKNGIILNPNNTINFISSGSNLIKNLDFEEHSANILLKLLEQASTKTFKISGDGGTTTILIACQLLTSAIRFLVSGYNSVFLGNGLEQLNYFILDQINQYAQPVKNTQQLVGVLKTALGKTVNSELFYLLKDCISQIGRDGLILVEENICEKNELDIVQGIELDRGFASTYFVNDLQNFEVRYEKPYILVSQCPINSLNQIRQVIEHIKETKRPLVIVADEISSDIISTLVLNTIQKKLEVVVVKYSSIKFLKTGILEDLSTLTYSNLIDAETNKDTLIFNISDLGQAEKVIVTKSKSTFIISKFSKVMAKRKINELNRELVNCETEYEKDIFKTRIARLSGNIAKVKIALSNQYEIDEQRQRIESAVNTIRSSLEEGILPGGGAFYLYLQNEIPSWSMANLIGDEVFASQIVCEALNRPFKELAINTNTPYYNISQEIIKKGYPFSFNLLEQKYVNTLTEGLLDSAKTVRAILWNALSLVSIIITSD